MGDLAADRTDAMIAREAQPALSAARPEGVSRRSTAAATGVALSAPGCLDSLRMFLAGESRRCR
jgi:hypothetical protein